MASEVLFHLDTDALNPMREETIQGVKVQTAMSFYHIPERLRVRRDEKRLLFEIEYMDNSERRYRRKIGGEGWVEFGKNSRRLYGGEYSYHQTGVREVVECLAKENTRSDYCEMISHVLGDRIVDSRKAEN